MLNQSIKTLLPLDPIPLDRQKCVKYTDCQLFTSGVSDLLLKWHHVAVNTGLELPFSRLF